MNQLVEKYRPLKLAEFVGLEKARAIFRKLANAPWESAWLLVGASGTGKTTMGLALADEMGAELHHIPSRQCGLETVQAVIDRCHYVPFGGGWHIILVDEADQMSRPAQLAFLSKLDATARPPRTIFVFTANETNLLEDRFLSRCRILSFSEEGLGGPAAEFLSRIFAAEGGDPRKAPDFAELFRKSGNNIRAALNNLELELLEPGIGVAHALGAQRPERQRHSKSNAGDPRRARRSTGDPRVPPPGTILTKEFRGQRLEVKVQSHSSFKFGGRDYTSLSAIASEICAGNRNGFTFFGLKEAA